MKSLFVIFVLPLWAAPGRGTMTLNSVVLREAGRTRRPAGPVLSRLRRSWVWNQFFILEEESGDEPLYVGKLHSDMDQGDGQVMYHLSGDGAMSIFTIDEQTGDIHAIRRLDREQRAYYTLRAQVRDRSSLLPLEPESQFIIKVQDINDNAPRFLDGPYTARIPERSPVGMSVLRLTATDADDPTYGNSARLVYSVLQGLPHFSVDPHSGVVRTAQPDLDREIRDQYQLVIQAKDMLGQMGGLSGTTGVTVTLTDVNDNPPRFPRRSYQFTVSELVPVLSVVARIKAVDLDEGPNAAVIYRILEEDGPGTFQILTDPNTQEALLTLLKDLNFEHKSSHLLKIEASNQDVDPQFLLVGPFSDVTMVRLLVEDEDELPVFSPPASPLAVSEAAAVGTDVGSVSARDPDGSGGPIRYSIDRTSDMGHYFDIDQTSGTIKTSRSLDREVRGLHNITVLGTEALDPSQVGSAVVLVSVTDVNDNPPSLAAEYRTSVCENAPPGQVIQILSAMDPDDPENGHHFLFFMPEDAPWNRSFTLRDNNDNTASVLVLQSKLLRRDQRILLPVVIDDGGSPSLSSTNTLTVSVCDCDRHENHRLCSRDELWRGAGGAATLTGALTVLGVVMVMTVIRWRRREPEGMEEEEYIQENIVCYNDEGGGEEDTEAFDMSALRNLDRLAEIQKTRLLREFIRERLLVVDLDPTAPPVDSLQTYALEGSCSAAQSLSSLSSSEPEQSFSFLRAWGPSFGGLADLYGEQQRGGVAS